MYLLAGAEEYFMTFTILCNEVITMLALACANIA